MRRLRRHGAAVAARRAAPRELPPRDAARGAKNARAPSSRDQTASLIVPLSRAATLTALWWSAGAAIARSCSSSSPALTDSALSSAQWHMPAWQHCPESIASCQDFLQRATACMQHCDRGADHLRRETDHPGRVAAAEVLLRAPASGARLPPAVQGQRARRLAAVRHGHLLMMLHRSLLCRAVTETEPCLTAS